MVEMASAGRTPAGSRAEQVRIVKTAVAYPPHRITQKDAVEQVVGLLGERRRVTALARGSGIERRALAISPAEVARLGGTLERNEIYRQLAPELAFAAARAAVAGTDTGTIGCLATSSCTGCVLPGWGVDLVGELGLPWDVARTPVTESGCAGGVVSLERAADFLATRPGASALVVGTELCSLAFHAETTASSLTASLLFGDGAGASVLATGPGEGLTILDSASALVPSTQHLLGFDLTDHGFYPVLRRELVECLAPAATTAAGHLLARNGLDRSDVTAWLLHPGGARILTAIATCGAIPPEQLRWSWASMEECGNMSSAAIFDVIRRYQEDADAPPGLALIAAFGPGVSIELLLVRREC